MYTARLMTLLEELASLTHGDGQTDLLTHSLQTAWHGVMAGADSEAVAAALVHDIGIHPEVAADHPGLGHEEAARLFLWPILGPRVGWLAGAHTLAKRYLAAIDPGYERRCGPLVTAELYGLGGPFNAFEARDFLRHPWSLDAVHLAHWDLMAPVPDALPPNLDVFVMRLEPLVLGAAAV